LNAPGRDEAVRGTRIPNNLKNSEPILKTYSTRIKAAKNARLATIWDQDILDVAEKGKPFISEASNKYFTRHVSVDNPTEA